MRNYLQKALRTTYLTHVEYMLNFLKKFNRGLSVRKSLQKALRTTNNEKTKRNHTLKGNTFVSLAARHVADGGKGFDCALSYHTTTERDYSEN